MPYTSGSSPRAGALMVILSACLNCFLRDGFLRRLLTARDRNRELVALQAPYVAQPTSRRAGLELS